MIINTPNINEARKQIQKIKKENPGEEIVVRAQDDDFNRKVVEDLDIDVLLSPEIHNRRDRLKQRDSGLNEILCRIAAKKNIKLGIDVDELIRLGKKDKSRIIARIIQNIDLCKKTGINIVMFPRKKHERLDLMSFLLSLGSSTSQAKKAVE